jgi:hypothetical protein
MSCQEQGYPKISWWYLRKWEGHCGWGRMRGAIPVAPTWWEFRSSFFFKSFGFSKKFRSITSVGYLLEFVFLEVLLCYGIAFVFSCYALEVQICLTWWRQEGRHEWMFYILFIWRILSNNIL